jgi:hypothetical protein
VRWFARIKIPGSSMWADVRRDRPLNYYDSIYKSKEAAIEAAKAELTRRRTPQKSLLPR